MVICSNCGSENPEGNLYCNECGARLQDTGSVPVPVEAGAGAASGPMPAGETPDGGSTSSPRLDQAGAVGESGPAVLQDQEAELLEQDSMQATGQAPAPTYDARQMPMEGQYEQGAPEMDAGMASEQEGALASEGEEHGMGLPVTEDTMAPADQGQDVDGEQPSTTEYGEMPHVIPVASAGEGATQQAGAADYEEVAPAASGQAVAVEEPAAGTQGTEWASQALNQLGEAQGAIARGDWMTFGQALDRLRSILEHASQGAPAPSPVSGASAMPASHVEERTVEPAAEAGALGTSYPQADQASQAQPGMGVEEGQYVAMPAAAAQDTSSQNVPRLVVISSGAELPLPDQDEITVGREDPSSGIFPDVDLTPYGGEEGGVSRRHARILRIDGEYYVEDLQSTNYTKLDGQRLPAHVREKLDDSARLDFGRVAVIFRRS